jgi:hypothetical protein
MGRMSRKEWSKFLDRDLSCVHCGKMDETLVPQHRANRGMGGSHKKEKPSNVVVMCSWFNCQIEMDAYAANLAKTMGWKLEQWQDADKFPIYHHGKWWMLDDNFGRVEVPFWGEPD